MMRKMSEEFTIMLVAALIAILIAVALERLGVLEAPGQNIGVVLFLVLASYVPVRIAWFVIVSKARKEKE